MNKRLNPVVEVKDLSYAYRSVRLFSGVGFSVFPGDFVSLIGANGAGKSTLLKLLLGELSPLEGEVLLFGEPVRQFRSWPWIGYVPQGGNAITEGFPATVAEVVAMGLYGLTGFLRPARGVRRQVQEALSLVGMEGESGRMISRLSGGQVQRVLIARALAAKSRVLLLDEPATGVDGEAVLALYELLARLNGEQGIAILMVTHDIARATPYVNRTLCLEEGSLVELDKEQIAREMEHKHRH